MPDVISLPLISVTAGGITIIGIATGLDPALLFAGSCGGWWAISYMGQQELLVRLNNLLLSSVIAAWTAPAIVGWLLAKGWLTDSVDSTAWQYVAALGVGLLAVPVLGVLVMESGKEAIGALKRWIAKKGDA